MREKLIENHGNKHARGLDFYVRKYVTPANRAAPDDIYAKHGHVFWIEYKATGEKPTPLQYHEHELMRAKGLLVFWTDSKEGAEAIINTENDKIKWLD